MSSTRQDLYGNAPDKSPVVLLLIDYINAFDFESGAELYEQALLAARKTAELRREAESYGCPVIYVNDNFGRWRSDFKTLIEHCSKPDQRGRDIVEILRPGEKDYFVLKPTHSGFYSTTLDLLLEHLGVRRVILTGVATNNCVLFTAHEAFLRGYEIIVPADCVGANTLELSEAALRHMKDVLKAEVLPAEKLPWNMWIEPSAVQVS